jgi:HEPN domain-containing protein
MPPDPQRSADTAAWLAKAREDMRAARVGLAADPPLLADALFHAQQVIEKALKAFLTWYDQPFRRSHDLGELGLLCAHLDATLEPLLREAAPLTEYAWRYRYPGDPSDPDAREAGAALALAEQVLDAVASRLRPE